MRHVENEWPGDPRLEIKSTGDLFSEIDEAMAGTARWLANDLGMPSLALHEAREKLLQLRELVAFLGRA